MTRTRRGAARVVAAAAAVAMSFAGVSGAAAARGHPLRPHAPHRVLLQADAPYAVAPATGYWISSNTGPGRTGITVFRSRDDALLATRVIDQAGLALPVFRVGGDGPVPPRVESLGGGSVAAPAPAGGRSRLARGIVVDRARGYAYQVVERSGLRWNRDRTGFQRAGRADDESGMVVIWNVSNPSEPFVAGGFLTGHAPSAVTVDPATGRVYVANGNSPGVDAPNFVTVYQPDFSSTGWYLSGWYGFVDTGYFQAVQALCWDPVDRQVKMVSLVGETMFALNSQWPRANAHPTADKRVGQNTIAWSLDLRPSFVRSFPEPARVMELPAKRGPVSFSAKDFAGMPTVLHFGGITVDPRTGVSYATVSSVGPAQHTGSPAEAQLSALAAVVVAATPSVAVADRRRQPRFTGRWLVAVTPDRRVTWTDLSHGYGVAAYPDVPTFYARSGDQGRVAVDVLETSWVNGGSVAVEPDGSVVVGGERTGNLGLVRDGVLRRVLPVSALRPGARADAVTGLFGEPRVRDVTVDRATGRVLVTEQGGRDFLGSVLGTPFSSERSSPAPGAAVPH
jgi:hypothetical protein